MKFKLIFTILIISFAISCEKEEINKNDKPFLCVGDSKIPFGGIPNCDKSSTADSIFCEVKYGGSFNLEESSKFYMHQYCNKVGSKLEFENSQGQLIIFEITSKSFIKSCSLHNTFKKCDTNSSKNIGYSINMELLSLRLSSTQNNILLDIVLTTIPNINSSEIGLIGDELRVLRTDGSPGWILEFEAIVNQRTLSYDKKYGQEYFKKVELNNKEYNEVYSKDISNYSNPGYKYYFNKEYGLIGFVDKGNTIWTIKN